MPGVEAAIGLSAIIISLVVILQSLELLRVQSVWSENGIWRWQDLRDEIGASLPWLNQWKDYIWKDKNFRFILLLRIFLALVLAIRPHWFCALLLFFSHIAICVRWRGTYNGGSDVMSLVVLSGLTISLFFPVGDWWRASGLYYIGVQSISSYFMAGLAKLRQREWRSGEVLPRFLKNSPYVEVREFVEKCQNQRWLFFLGAWAILLFECLFPLCLLDVKLCALLLFFGLLFHLANSRLLGLNRFLLVWLSTYPALLLTTKGARFLIQDAAHLP